jgi:hypothetical protein
VFQTYVFISSYYLNHVGTFEAEWNHDTQFFFIFSIAMYVSLSYINTDNYPSVTFIITVLALKE